MSGNEISPSTALDFASTAALPASARVRPLSLRSNFAWAVAGNVIYAACQWGMIVALAKLGSSFMVGQFSLGLALVTPVLMLSNLDLRAVQATDAQRQFRFSEYLRLRLALTFAALIVIVGIVRFGAYESRTGAVILALALAKSIETLSDIHYGLFQLNDRLDQTGRSMILRGVLSVIALSVVLYLLRSVAWACLGVALAWTAALLLFDVRRGRLLVSCTEGDSRSEGVSPAESAGTAKRTGSTRQARLLTLALPLGLVTTIASVNLHMPRYFVHAHMGEHELGIFSAIAYAAGSLTLVGDSLAISAVPRLARLYAGGRRVEYRALLLRLLAIGSAVGLIGLAVARGMGAWLLRIFYNRDYAAQSHLFTLLMAAAAIHFAASMLTSGITSARRFRIQVPLYLLVAGSTALGCALWVPAMGLTGAALGVICGAAVRLVLAAAVVGWLLLPEAA
jgi:O-antigen/teichoic acid export membrane protein